MNAKELGIFSGCAALGVKHDEFEEYRGFVQGFEDSELSKVHAIKVACAYLDILDKLNLQEEPVYPLVKSAVVKADNDQWDGRCTAVSDGIYEVMAKMANIQKVAAGAAAAGIGLKGVVALSLLTGVGAGALYWTLKRDAQLDSAPNEKLRGQIDYYRSLSRDIEGSIERKMKQQAVNEAGQS